ncbi:MAG: hypothetical protein D6690_04640 [Nitrospirae bacterium]|nr:MAG: hypothetical protein D6690_04640 [Nitrospirota bacterium]
MPLSDNDFETLLNDSSKCINGNIEWRADEDQSSCVEFRVEVESETGWPLFVRGSFNPRIPALS